jgi:NSS family neurotransmitter:Na+ symporter
MDPAGSLKRGRWSSQAGFVIAAIGSAIGLGNIWRFSYLVYKDGGGAFLIPYLIALLVLGIPLLILEFAIGHERIGSAPLAYAKIHHKWEWLGWWAVVIVMFGIVLYYTVIISWCGNYLLFAFSKAWGDDPVSFFGKTFLGGSTSAFDFGGINMSIWCGLVIIWLVNWLIVYRGLRGGLELANKVFMPLLFLLVAILVVWGLGLEGAGNGIAVYLTPRFSMLKNWNIWLDAFSQMCFTLSLGFGIMIAYASYLPEKCNITGSALCTGLVNSGFSIFAGFAVFSILGYMSVKQGIPVEKIVESPIAIAFMVYPKAISLLPRYGSLFGIIFFLALCIAGVSSSISIIEAFVASMMDKFGVSRKKCVTLTCLAGFICSQCFTTSAGVIWLDVVDHFISCYCLVTVVLLECLLVTLFFGTTRLRGHINRVSPLQLGKWWDVLISAVLPIILLVFMFVNLVEEVAKPYGGYSWSTIVILGINWILLAVFVALVISWIPWKTPARSTGGKIDIWEAGETN